MNLKHRISELERRQGIKDNPLLWDIAVFEDVPIVLEGVHYAGIEDIPLELREKYKNRLVVGRITSKHGWVENIHAPDVDDEHPFERTKHERKF